MALKLQLGLLLFLALPGTRARAQQVTTTEVRQADLIVGVLEDFPGENAYEPDFRAVRATFKKIGDDWQAFPTKTRSYRDLETLPTSYPSEMTWTIAFDGRRFGTITSRTPSHFKF